MLVRTKRLSSAGLIVTLLGSVMIAGSVTLASPAQAATADLSSTWSANIGGGDIVDTAGVIATGAGGGSCSSLLGGAGAQVAGAIALAASDTLIAYPGGLGSVCLPASIGGGGVGGVSADPNGTYRGGNAGNGTDGTGGGSSSAESGGGGGAATTVYRNTSTQVAFAGGGGGAGGDAVTTLNTQVQGGTAGNGAAASTSPGGAGGVGGATPGTPGNYGGNGGTAGVSPWSQGKDSITATCSFGPCGGPAGGGAGSNSSTRSQDGAATAPEAAGGGGGQGGASAGPGLAGTPLFSPASSVAAGSASVTYIDITAGSVNNAAQSGTYTGTSFTVDSGWSGLAWSLAGSPPAGLLINAASGAISGTVTAPAGIYTFDVVATANPSSGPLSSFSLKTKRSVTMTVAPAAAPTFTSSNSTSAVEGSAMTPFTITTTGIPDATVSLSAGTLPSGLSFTPGAGGTATISGTPASGTAGAHQVTLKAANGVSPDATQVFTVTVSAPPGTSQVPMNGCVTSGGTTSIPRRGIKRLMQPGCITNAVQRVGVKVNSATLRGDLRYYKLYCSYNGKAYKTVSAGSGDAYRMCKSGSLMIRTYGFRLKLRITWHAPTAYGYSAYTFSKTYKT